MTEYQTYQELLDKGRNNAKMDFRERDRLIKDIDKLDKKDHIGILRIIMESIDRQIWTVNNYGTYFDLNDLDNTTLWKISYHVSLCLENLERESMRKKAEKKYEDDRTNMEDTIKTKAKLKLSKNRFGVERNNEKFNNDEDHNDDDNNDEDNDDEDNDDNDESSNENNDVKNIKSSNKSKSKSKSGKNKKGDLNDKKCKSVKTSKSIAEEEEDELGIENHIGIRKNDSDDEDDPSQSILPNDGINFLDLSLLEDDDDTLDLDMDNDSDL
tara:strand:+ start:5970 stop:6776 length:807 start_codon:yes stop_codon:yes gene_type:complete